MTRKNLTEINLSASQKFDLIVLFQWNYTYKLFFKQKKSIQVAPDSKK